jgi:sugar fermentation stimulation protein A
MCCFGFFHFVTFIFFLHLFWDSRTKNLMQFISPLIEGRLIRRYKRFLADVELCTGEMVTAHCANPGAMLGLTTAGARVYVSRSPDPNRKLSYSWELVEGLEDAHSSQLIGINTSHPNKVAEEALLSGRIPELSGFAHLKREVKYGVNSRIDLLLTGADGQLTYVEVKNVHLMRQKGLAEFPDSVTTRGTKHLHELADMVAQGHRAVMLYVIQMHAERFTLASDIDPTYAKAFYEARGKGVEALAYICTITPQDIELSHKVEII